MNLTMKTTFKKMIAVPLLAVAIMIGANHAHADTTSSSPKAPSLRVNVLKGFHDKQVKVAFEQVESLKPVRIKIKDRNNQLLYLKQIRGKKQYMNLFNFENLPAGDYIIEFSSRDETFQKIISI